MNIQSHKNSLFNLWIYCFVGTSQGQNLGQSVFDYIEKQHSKSPIFYNFMFSPESDYPVSLFLLLLLLLSPVGPISKRSIVTEPGRDIVVC